MADYLGPCLVVRKVSMWVVSTDEKLVVLKVCHWVENLVLLLAASMV